MKNPLKLNNKFKTDDPSQDSHRPDIGRERSLDNIGTKDVRSESIASLRAKALEHCAKITQQERRFSDHVDQDADRGETIDTDLSHYNSVFSNPRQEKNFNVTLP